MIVEIWTTRGTDPRCLRDPSKAVEPLKLQEVDMPCIPRKGELLEIFDGWASEIVGEVWWDVESKRVTINVSPDYTGQYAAEVERRAQG